MSWFSKKHDPLKHELNNARQALEGAVRANVKANERVSVAAAEAGASGEKLRDTVELVMSRLRSQAHA